MVDVHLQVEPRLEHCFSATYRRSLSHLSHLASTDKAALVNIQDSPGVFNVSASKWYLPIY